MTMTLDVLPTVNALLNSSSAILLIFGHRYIKRGNREAHKKFMLAAFMASILFFISYITYHSYHGSTIFAGQGWIRPVYFTILTTHTVAATAIVPLAIITLRSGMRERFDRDVKIARWTYPLWLFVSVSGVIVYLMLYHLYPTQ